MTRITIVHEFSGDLLRCESCKMEFFVFAFSQWEDEHTEESNQSVIPQVTEICPYCGKASHMKREACPNG